MFDFGDFKYKQGGHRIQSLTQLTNNRLQIINEFVHFNKILIDFR